MNQPTGEELFAIKGNLRRFEVKGLLRRWPHFFTAYTDGLCIEVARIKLHIHIDSILDVYRQDNVLDSKTPRKLIIIYMNSDSNSPQSMEVNSDMFPEVIEKVEALYENEWKQYGRNYSKTVKWLLACTAIAHMDLGTDFAVFGKMFEHEIFTTNYRDGLAKDWSINNKEELLEMCDSLYNGRTVTYCEEYFSETPVTEIKEPILKIRDRIMSSDGKSVWAWDLWRIIHICNFGLQAGYLTRDEALELSLKAGEKIQKLHSSWDDFHEHYLLGFCVWSGEDMDEKGTTANNRKTIYEEVKKLPTNPWTITWNTALKREW